MNSSVTNTGDISMAADKGSPSSWGSPWLRLIGAIIVVALLASGVTKLRFDNSTEAFFLKDDPTLEQYDRFRGFFASDEYSLITFQRPDQLNQDFLAGLDALEQRLAQIENVRDVTSLLSVRSIDGSSGVLDVRGYLESVDESELAKRVNMAGVVLA